KLGVDYLSEIYFCSRIRYVDDIPIQLETVYMPAYLFPDLNEKYYSKFV
ncbi:MAG: UTRA domain-containing protein, partial [Mycoplasmatales bacterium]